MAMHRRIPKKNRKKLKSVDPFNNKANAARFQENKKSRNNAPQNLREEQPLTKAQKSLMSEHNPIVTKADAKKKKKEKNAVLQQAQELGLKKGKFETVNRFVRRIEGNLHARINETMAIAKHGLAGRKQEEIDADYAKIDEAEKRKKDQEKREIENKIKEARKKREAEAKRREEAEKAREMRKAAKRKAEEEEKEEKGEESMDDEEDDSEDDVEGKKVKKTKKAAEGGEEEEGKGSLKNLKKSKKERRKETLKARKTDEQKRRAGEAVLNSREVIAFGERYDAPPTFGGDLKKKFEPLMAKAGQKTLLLHTMLQKGKQKTEYLNDSTKIQEERQRVIDAYRNMKKQKNQMGRAAEDGGSKEHFSV